MARIPIDIASGRLKAQNLVVGIDLGTTNSLIARMVDGRPEAIADYGQAVAVPSVVHFRGFTPEVGESAKSYLVEDPAHTIYSVKRLMGKSYREVAQDAGYFSYEIIENEADGLVRIKIGNRFFTPAELSAVILTELRRRAEHRLKVPVEKAVITVPAYFNDTQRQATRDAGKLAGLEVLRIINEPTAAALAYGLGLNPAETKTVAVYDFGGGTFDVTILRIESGIFEVLATNGDTYLGGDDMDEKVLLHFLSQLDKDLDWLKLDPPLYQTMRLTAEEAKKALSAEAEFRKMIRWGRHMFVIDIDRQTFDGLIEPLIARTLNCCRQALADASLASQDVDEVLMVGGCTRIPAVHRAVEGFFGKTPNTRLDPDEVVALGAAVQADILAGNRTDLLLLDVTPLSLGIETLGGLMDVLLPRNAKVPARAARQYTTSRDGQVNLRISVYQGEREQVAHNRMLAEFELRGIPAMPAALPKVEIVFLLDADGILRVEATELRSGARQQVVVNPQSGLTDETVEQMLRESLTNAQADLRNRLTLEAQQEASQLIYNAENFLAKHAVFFSEDEITGLRTRLEALRNVALSADKDVVLAAIKCLDDYSKPMAERVMSAAVDAALKGRQVDGTLPPLIS